MKTLNKCVLSSLVSHLFFDRQLLNVGQTKPRLLFMYIKVCREKNHVDNFLCELCCSFIVKTPMLIWILILN